MTAISKYPGFFVDVMMVHELGLSIPDSAPAHNAAAVAGGFALAAAVPLGLAHALLPRLLQQTGAASVSAAVASVASYGALREHAEALASSARTLAAVATHPGHSAEDGIAAVLALAKAFAAHPATLLGAWALVVVAEALLVRRQLAPAGGRATRWLAPFMLLALASAACAAAVGVKAAV